MAKKIEAEQTGHLAFTVDFPAILREMITNDANLKNIGPGGAFALVIAMMKLNNIARIAIRQENAEILRILEEMGVVGE